MNMVLHQMNNFCTSNWFNYSFCSILLFIIIYFVIENNVCVIFSKFPKYRLSFNIPPNMELKKKLLKLKQKFPGKPKYFKSNLFSHHYL